MEQRPPIQPRSESPPVDLAGDQLEAMYHRYGERLMRMANFLVGPDQAGDVVIETMVRAVRSASFAKVAVPLEYLTRMLVNEAHRYRDREHRRVAREQRVATAADSSTTSTASAAENDRDDVRAAVRTLSHQQRAIVYLSYWEDCTIPDIAVRLDVSEGTVRRQLARAKDRLRKVL